MKVKEFGARPSGNVKSGGQRRSYDEYNRSFKGDPYNIAYKKEHYRDSLGYMSRDNKEYNRFPEIKDETVEQDDKKKEIRQNRSKTKAQTVLRSVVGLVVGSVILVSAYQAMTNGPDGSDIIDNPGIVNSDPSGEGSKPEGQESEPSGQVSEPSGQSSEQSGQSSEQSGQQSEQSGQSSESSGQSSEQSGQQSEQSGQQSEQSGQQSEQSGQQSEQSGQESETSRQESEPHSETSEASEHESSGSEASTEQSSQGEPSGTTEVSASWQWNEDNTSVILVIKDSNGNVIGETPAEITTKTTSPTCREAGTVTYTAKAEAEGKAYTDTRSEELPALGHSFDSGREVILENGQTAMGFECSRCGEHFTVINSIDEE